MTVIALALAGGCSKKDSAGQGSGSGSAAPKKSWKDRATGLAAKYGPKLGELSKKLPDLASHAKDVPVDVPGANQLGKLLEENKSTLAEAQDVLAKLPEKLGTESDAEAEKELAEAEKKLAKDVEVIEKDEEQESAIIREGAGKTKDSGSAAASGSNKK